MGLGWGGCGFVTHVQCYGSAAFCAWYANLRCFVLCCLCFFPRKGGCGFPVFLRGSGEILSGLGGRVLNSRLHLWPLGKMMYFMAVDFLRFVAHRLELLHLSNAKTLAI